MSRESGTQVILEGVTPGKLGVTKVGFHLTGWTLNNALVATGPPTYLTVPTPCKARPMTAPATWESVLPFR